MTYSSRKLSAVFPKGQALPLPGVRPGRCWMWNCGKRTRISFGCVSKSAKKHRFCKARPLPFKASATAPPNIQLDGAVKGAPPIEELGPEGVPVIPTKPGALGELLNSAPLVVERLATLTDRLTLLLSDKNQQSIEGILKNTE